MNLLSFPRHFADRDSCSPEQCSVSVRPRQIHAQRYRAAPNSGFRSQRERSVVRMSSAHRIGFDYLFFEFASSPPPDGNHRGRRGKRRKGGGQQTIPAPQVRGPTEIRESEIRGHRRASATTSPGRFTTARKVLPRSSTPAISGQPQ